MNVYEALELLKENGLDLELIGLLSTKSYFNTLYLVENVSGKYVLRIANERLLKDKDEEGISKEYQFVGFTHNGDDLYRLRGVLEQVSFADYVRKNGFKTPTSVFANKDFMLREYIDGKGYDDYLAETSDEQMISKYLTDVVNMHQKDIVIGDLNGMNTIIVNRDMFYIDFDIKLEKIPGESEPQKRKDFELTQALFYSVRYLGEKEKIFNMLKTIQELFKNNNIERIKRFLSRYIEYKELRIKRDDYETEKAVQYSLTNDTVRELIKKI